MRGDGGRNEGDFFEVKCPSNFFSPPKVTQMDGVKSSPEHANPPLRYLRSLFYLCFPPLVDCVILAFWSNGIVE
jgi:hypothetical protein